jgi:hypothetical protein
MNPIPCVPFPLRKGARGFIEGKGMDLERGVSPLLGTPVEGGGGPLAG